MQWIYTVENFLGSTEGYMWIAILEGICALGLLGLFFKSIILFGESETPMVWLPIIGLAGLVFTSVAVFALMDFWIWLLG